ncbi:MAG: hypothetical protein Fur0018_16640 [Anaerolineales bacterium]
MPVNEVISPPQVNQAVQLALETHGHATADLVAVLQQINDHLGYVPTLAIVEIARRMGMPPSRVYSIATFYSMIATEPCGRHVVQFCESAPCHVTGGRELWQALCDALGIQAGETTPDGEWTLVTTSCLGQCDRGPNLIIDDDLHFQVTPQRLKALLAQYTTRSEANS